MSKKKKLLVPCSATIPLSSVPGEIKVKAMLSPVIVAGTIRGGAVGVTFSLKTLQDALNVAIDRLCPEANIQIVSRTGICPPILVISDEFSGIDGRECVVVGGIPVDEGAQKTPKDAIEAVSETL